MPIFALSAGAENLNKYYLEQALLAYSINKPDGYLRKCAKLNEILNRIMRDEVKYGVYIECVKLPKNLYTEIFG